MRSLKFLLLFACCFSFATHGTEFQKGSLIYDTEIDDTLKDFAVPLFQAANLNPKALKLYVIVDPSLNAAATLNYTILLHTGLLLETENVGQVIGVLAHETGHIASGHIARTFEAIQNVQKKAIVGMGLGLLAALAGQGDLAAATVAGTMHVAERSFLSYSRSQEGSADQAGLRLLDKLNWPARGLAEFLEKLGEQELLSPAQQDPYARTHPLSRERVEGIKHHIAKSTVPSKSLKNSSFITEAPLASHHSFKGSLHTPTLGIHQKSFPLGFEEKFKRIQAKLFAFLKPPHETFKKYSGQNIVDRYARAIAFFQKADFKQALKDLDQLIQDFPKDPYFIELKGEILSNQGRVKEAIKAYDKAISLLPKSAFLRASRALLLLSDSSPKNLEKALNDLETALKVEKEEPFIWHQMAIAQGRAGHLGLAALALAEKHLLERDYSEARAQAQRALQNLKKNTPQALRAEDIKNNAEQELSKSR